MRILNVGCAGDTEGTDFIDKYPQRPEIVQCDIEDGFPHPDETFDKVIARNILEHVRNPDILFKESYRCLKNNGVLHIETDNAAYWLFHNDKSKVRIHSGGYEKLGEEDKHFTLFTPHHLDNFFRDNGFTVSKTGYYYDFEGVGWKVRLIESILKRTRFNQMAFPKVMGVGRKCQN